MELKIESEKEIALTRQKVYNGVNLELIFGEQSCRTHQRKIAEFIENPNRKTFRPQLSPAPWAALKNLPIAPIRVIKILKIKTHRQRPRILPLQTTLPTLTLKINPFRKAHPNLIAQQIALIARELPRLTAHERHRINALTLLHVAGTPHSRKWEIAEPTQFEVGGIRWTV